MYFIAIDTHVSDIKRIYTIIDLVLGPYWHID